MIQDRSETERIGSSTDESSLEQPLESQMAEQGKSVSDIKEKEVKAPNLVGRAKEEFEAVTHSPSHHEETHGRSEDIDENTPVEEVKGPGFFERAKEEIEAVVEAILPTKK